MKYGLFQSNRLNKELFGSALLNTPIAYVDMVMSVWMDLKENKMTASVGLVMWIVTRCMT